MQSNGQTQHFLVTGGAGFIGSHLCDALLEQGYQVSVIDNLSTGKLENIAHLLEHPRFHFARADVNNTMVLDRLASTADVIVHLAAAVGVKLVVEQPVHTIRTNIIGTKTVLETALRYQCRTLIASTSEVYGKGSRIPFSEDDDVVLGPTSKSRWGYASSKMVDEFLGLAYQAEYDLEVVPFRLFNTVGARQTGRYGMVVPTFVRQALRGEPITVYGDGTQSRCFCHVEDVVRAIIGLSVSSDSPGRVYNVGNTEEISILKLAETVKTHCNSDSSIHFVPYDVAYAPGFEDMQRRVPDINRIQNLLDWKPGCTLKDILESVIAYEEDRI